MDVTYEWSDTQNQTLYHSFHNELTNGLLGKLFISPSSPQKRQN